MDRLFISFETDPKPSDAALEDEQVAGQPVFEQIISHCVRQPCDGISEWDAYGWAAEFAIGPAKLTCMLQRSEEWLVLVSARRTFMDKMKGRNYETELQSLAHEVCGAIKSALGIPLPKCQTEGEFTRR